MTITATTAFNSQIDQVYKDAESYAQWIASYVDAAGPAADTQLDSFLEGLPVPPGTVVLFTNADGVTFKTHRYPSEGPEQTIPAAARPRTRPWTISVGVPTAVAWQRAVPVYRVTIAISGLATIILIAVQVVFLRRLLPALRALERSATAV